ncbi:hypothetical protein [Streptomyces chumphonensis]|uniref:hypothetical protein n=1 Tax=Streptomyces chumphonensis TaxID=1214925 RepID=UPI003D732547
MPTCDCGAAYDGDPCTSGCLSQADTGRDLDARTEALASDGYTPSTRKDLRS